jgi:hypothetical protein
MYKFSQVTFFIPASAIRTSLSDYRQESWMTNIPLYAIETGFSL